MREKEKKHPREESELEDRNKGTDPRGDRRGLNQEQTCGKMLNIANH